MPFSSVTGAVIPPLSFLHLPKANLEEAGTVVTYQIYIITEMLSYPLAERSIAWCCKGLVHSLRAYLALATTLLFLALCKDYKLPVPHQPVYLALRNNYKEQSITVWGLKNYFPVSLIAPKSVKM